MQTDIHEMNNIRDPDYRVRTEDYSHALDHVAIYWTYALIGG
jgi:hypothetical protein